MDSTVHHVRPPYFLLISCGKSVHLGADGPNLADIDVLFTLSRNIEEEV